VECGNRARIERVPGTRLLREQKFQWEKGGRVRRRHAGDFFEADAFVTQFRMRELLFGRRFLAQMGYRVRVSRLLCIQQQQDQQTGQDAMQFHERGGIQRAV